jgi:hypothetical protein
MALDPGDRLFRGATEMARRMRSTGSSRLSANPTRDRSGTRCTPCSCAAGFDAHLVTPVDLEALDAIVGEPRPS